ncbi:hypothetical protein [Janthinobacterium sp.]
MDELMEQMARDCDIARTILNSCASGPLSTG